MYAIPLADGLELALTREAAPQPGEWFRLALHRRAGADRMLEGGFLGERRDMRLLLIGFARLTRLVETQGLPEE